MTTSDQAGGDAVAIQELLARLWKDYRVLSNSPRLLKPLAKDVLALIGVWDLTHDLIQAYPVPNVENGNLSHFIAESNAELAKLEDCIVEHRFHRLTFHVDNFLDVQERLLEKTEALLSFYKILRSRSRNAITDALLKVPFSVETQEFLSLTEPQFAVFQETLPRYGISAELARQEFYFIESWLKSSFPSGFAFHGRISEPTEGCRPRLPIKDSLPDYHSGPSHSPECEKRDDSQSSVLNHEKPPSSPKAAPPAYTFEEGNDELMDDEFSEYIREAIATEDSIRLVQQESHLEAVIRPWGWLPDYLQDFYKKGHNDYDVIPMLASNSFSAMAYDTSLRCLEEIARLESLLRDSHGPEEEARHSLKVMSTALTKFALLRNQRTDSEAFSDLDSLEFEFSTAVVMDSKLPFPHEDFDMAQKSCYRLLTYVMGFLSAFSSIYTGRTYLARPFKDIEEMWRAKNMGVRTAWVEKQLTVWANVETAISNCRDFHLRMPSLRSQAMTALKDWQEASRILAGTEGSDTIEMRIVSVQGLIKPKLRLPSAFVQIIVYVANRFGGGMRSAEFKTDAAQKTQFPVWNQSFLIVVPRDAKWIDLDIYDRVTAVNSSKVSKEFIRLHFSWIPRFEANFCNRSFLYDMDEELELPFELDGKGKETVPPTIKIGLRWTGRQSRAHRLGLPTKPPGKMFKSDARPIPCPPRSSLDGINSEGAGMGNF
ncbi:hypothetical protein BP5796_05404 [Coleophoma crateriformis]|uniref:C2 domain-containing protein n=1 Tax=Coleophoma crateriformis TaxID=565419 RepID=A0A3D8S367_9HELO|nr:hypothetical protein BP5796_05404 [Coleophoma crateriformis]